MTAMPRLLTTLLALFATPADVDRYLPPPDAPYVAEEVRLRSEGRNSLGGTLTLPTRGPVRRGFIRRYPGVLLVAGGNHQDRDGAVSDSLHPPTSSYRPLYDLADTLTRRGLAVLRVDDRGVGASTGSPDSTSLMDRAEDVRAALDYMRHRFELDPRRIAVLGLGEGGTVAQFVAASDSMVRGLVLMGSPPDSSAAKGLRAPALVLEGGADVRGSSRSARLASTLRSDGAPDVTVRVLPGLTHEFRGPTPPLGSSDPEHPHTLPVEVRGTVADWLAGELGAPTEVHYVAPRPAHHRRAHHTHRRRRR